MFLIVTICKLKVIFIKLFVTLRKEFKRNHPIQMVFKRGIGHFRNTQHIHTVQPAHQCDKPPAISVALAVNVNSPACLPCSIIVTVSSCHICIVRR